MPEGDDRGGKTDPDALGARGDVGRHQQRIGQELAAPDAEVVLGEPEDVDAGLLAGDRHFAQLVQEFAVVPLLGDVVDVLEVTETHDAISEQSDNRRRKWKKSLPRRRSLVYRMTIGAAAQGAAGGKKGIPWGSKQFRPTLCAGLSRASTSFLLPRQETSRGWPGHGLRSARP